MSELRAMIELDRFWDALVSGVDPLPEPTSPEQWAAGALQASGAVEMADELFLHRLWTDLSASAAAGPTPEPLAGERARPKAESVQAPRLKPVSVRRFARVLELAALVTLMFTAMVLIAGGDMTPDFDFWGGREDESTEVALLSGNAGRTGELDTAAVGDSPVKLWSTGVNGLSPRPVISNGRLFTGSCQMQLTALDMATGDLLWNASGLGISGAPAVRGDTVLVGGSEGVFYGLDAATGGERWSFTSAGASVCASPLIIDDGVYIPDDIGNLYALDAESGELRWQMSLPVASTQASGESDDPDCICLALISGDDDRIYAGTESGRVVAIDRRSGTILWTAETQTRSVLGTATDDGTVYVTFLNGPVEALDAETGALKWVNEDMTTQRTRVSVADGVVLVTVSSSTVTALDAETGLPIWTVPFREAMFRAPLMIIGNQVYIAFGGPAVVVLDLHSGELIAELGSDAFFMGPADGLAIDDGVIVVAGDAGDHIALGSPDK